MDPKVLELEARLRELMYPSQQQPNSVGTEFEGAPTAVEVRGRSYVHSLYPEEIEFYACALELVDFDGLTVEYFIFPIMPSSYSEVIPNNSSIEKTMGGIVVSNNPTFVPIDISMAGSFGRSFKKISTANPYNEKPISENDIPGVAATKVFSIDYKTGYGCYKILERILIKSQKEDLNYNPYRLYFYNLSLYHNYLVEFISITPNQNRDSSNMIWNYSLNLKAIAPAKLINKNFKSSLKYATDFSKKVQDNIEKSNTIDKILTENNKKKSRVQEIFERQATTRALNLLNNNERSALIGLLQLANSPIYDGEFIVDDSLITIGEGILNQF